MLKHIHEYFYSHQLPKTFVEFQEFLLSAVPREHRNSAEILLSTEDGSFGPLTLLTISYSREETDEEKLDRIKIEEEREIKTREKELNKYLSPKEKYGAL